MHTTFFQKFFLTVFAGFIAACIYYLFMHVFQNFDDAINKGYNTHTGLVIKQKRN